MLYRYQNTYGFKTIEKIFVLVPGKKLLDGLFLVNDDNTVRRILNYISRYSWVREINFYADHHVDTPLYMPQVLELTWETSNRGEVDDSCVEIGGGSFNEKRGGSCVETGGGHFNETEPEINDEPTTNAPMQCSNVNDDPYDAPVTENAQDTDFVPDLEGNT